MLRRLCWVLSLGVVVCGLSGSAFADFGTPSWWQDVQFGGSGIVGSNSQLVYDEISVGGETVRLALMAHGRYAYSQTVDIDTQTYYVETGKYGGTGGDKDYAKWNFGFYVAAGSVSQFLGVKLFYDFDPGKDSSPLNEAWFMANFSRIPDTTGDKGDPDTLDGEAEDSWNLAMNFLSQNIPAIADLNQDGKIDGNSENFPFGSKSGVYVFGVSVPSGPPGFNPNVMGEYTFKLEVFRVNPKVENGQIVDFQWAPEPLGGIEMRVNAVPEPATLVGLASLGASGLGAVVLRRRKKA